MNKQEKLEYIELLEEKARRLELNKIAREHNVGIDAIAIAYLLSKPFVNIIISGAATESQLMSNLEARNVNLTKTQIHKLNNLRHSLTSFV